MSVDGGKGNNEEKNVMDEEKDITDIQPVVYSFKGPTHSQTSGSIITAAKPPNWLYHDHVLGVIWMIFHRDKNYVGISQLQWSLKFLLDLKNSDGKYTEDVEICIQTIQDDLIEQYAKLGPVLDRSIEERSAREEKREIDVVEDMPSAIIVENEAKKNENEAALQSNDTMNKNENEVSTKSNDNMNENENQIVAAPSQGITGTSTPRKHTSQISEQENQDQYYGSNCSSKCTSKGGKMKTKDVISFTYNDMVSRGPAPCTEPYLIDETVNEHNLGIGNPIDMNSTTLMNFLASSRKQQMERINRETETLRVLELMMQNINISGSSAGNVEELAKQLENFANEDIIANNQEN